MFDPWPDEPEETNPESRWGNPERDLPRIPEPAVAEEDVDPEILETFWRSVVLANVALFGLSVGPMLVYFRGWWLWGGAAIAVGALAGLRVYQHYRAFERRHGDGEESRASKDRTTSDDGDGDGDGDATDDPERNA